jgi:hypothetical protein
VRRRFLSGEFYPVNACCLQRQFRAQVDRKWIGKRASRERVPKPCVASVPPHLCPVTTSFLSGLKTEWTNPSLHRSSNSLSGGNIPDVGKAGMNRCNVGFISESGHHEANRD